MISKTVLDTLKKLLIPYRLNVELKDYTYWRIGGPVDLLLEPKTEQQVASCVRTLADMGIPHVTIGDGTNVLVSDLGYRGAAIHIGRHLSGIIELAQQTDGSFGQDNEYRKGEALTQFNVLAGSWVPEVAHILGRRGFTGLEHTVGIPGTLGGLVFMNGGSLRHSISEAIDSVTILNVNHEIETIDADSCEFGYRRSRFQRTQEVILRAQISLNLGDPVEITRQMHEILTNRRHKFPRKAPSCGSVFVSDPALYEAYGPPGKMIETLGLKGMKIGGAKISEKHANFIVNEGQATAADVMRLVELIQHQAEKKFGKSLTTEFQYLS